MNFKIDSKKSNLTLALHVVVQVTEGHLKLVGKNMQYLYDSLQDGLGMACVPKLAYMLDRRMEVEKLDGYAEVKNFYEFAEVLYLTTVAYNVSQNLHQLEANPTEKNLAAYIDACVQQAVEDFLAATCVLNMDSVAYANMPYIDSSSSPLPSLRPMFYMIQTMLDKDTLQAVKKTFGVESLVNFVAMVGDANNNLMTTCACFRNHEQVIT